MKLTYEYDGTTIMAIQLIPECDLDRRITEVMYKHPGSLSVFKKFDDKEQPFMYIRFLTPDGRHIATVKDPPEASLEELLKRVIAIEDRLSK